MHTTQYKYKTHRFNFCAGSSSVGATGSAVEAECSMDIRGQFVNHDGLLGIVATLTDVGFSKRHNFNLLSVTSLWQQGWSTQSGDFEGLSILGPEGGSVINFDILVCTTRGGAVYVGRFVRLEHVNGTEKPVTLPFQHVHTDISQIKVLNDEDQNEVTLSKTSWIIRVDAFTGKEFSAFTATKKAFGESTVERLTQLAKRGAHVEVLRMDPSSKNTSDQAKIQVTV
jgi:hypothetical protein